MLPHIHFTLSGYAIMVGVGVFFALSLAYRRNQRFNFSLKELIVLIIANCLGVLVGSKLLFFVVMLPEWIMNFSFRELLERIVTSGFVFYGGLLGALLATYISCKVMVLDTKRVFNFLVPIYLAFHACGRIGCLLGGCCYGKESVIGFVMKDGVRRFPVQLLESLCILAILFVVVRVEKRRETASLLKVYLPIYALCRFCLEYLRGDEIRGIWGFFSTSQLVSISIIVVIVIGEICRRIKKKKVVEEKI